TAAQRSRTRLTPGRPVRCRSARRWTACSRRSTRPDLVAEAVRDPKAATLPHGWRMVTFGEVVRQTKVDADPETSGLERYVAGEHMGTDDLHIRSWGTVGDGYLGPAFHRKFVKGQIL